jgi:hypothetical protein
LTGFVDHTDITGRKPTVRGIHEADQNGHYQTGSREISATD